MRVTHVETWSVEADDEKSARAKLSALTPEVYTDETGGEVVDWEPISIKPADR